MSQNCVQTSLFVPLNGGDQLHMKRIYINPNGVPVFCLHGAIENGRIFYSDDDKGLAPYLARQGFDVFVGDLRGRGGSKPSVGRCSHHGQTESILEEIPAFLKTISRLKGRTPPHWIAHSWGGVLFMSTLARYPELAYRIESMVFFGTKRSIHVSNADKFFMIDFYWNGLAKMIAHLCGYLPARFLGLGDDAETKKSLQQSCQWIKPGPWIDSDDDFDYAKAIQQVKIPPTLYFAGANDACLGHPEDVKRFMIEAGGKQNIFHLLSTQTEHRHDYNHVDMLIHKDCEQDHFPMALEWLKKERD